MCCTQGKISLPPLHHPPSDLAMLLRSPEWEATQFHSNIHTYNNALAMTSVGRTLNKSLKAAEGGPISFRLHEEVIYRTGSLILQEGQQPLYAQLWIIDSTHIADAAHNVCMAISWNSRLDSTT